MVSKQLCHAVQHHTMVDMQGRAFLHNSCHHLAWLLLGVYAGFTMALPASQ